MLNKYQHTDIPIRYPLAKETINSADINALIDWLKEYPQLTKGKYTVEFEQKWAKWVGTKYAVNVNSGSSANLLMVYSLLILNRLKSKKVIVPSIGWSTTISPVIQLGLEPVMVDVDKNTYGIDLDETESLLKNNDIGAIFFVQQLGIPHYKDRLIGLCKKYEVPLLEDACAALGSSYED